MPLFRFNNLQTGTDNMITIFAALIWWEEEIMTDWKDTGFGGYST